MKRLRVKELAEARGWTMAKLQRAADVNARTIQGIYRNPYRDVVYSTLVKIAGALEVEISDLFEEIEDTPTS